MGVKRYQSWVRDRFPSRVSNELDVLLLHKGKQRRVRRLFLDLNAIIHAAVNKVYAPEDEEIRQEQFESPALYWENVVDTLVDEIIEIMEIVKPEYLMYLGADGTVGKAKMLQQRQRTYKSAAKTEAFNRNNVKPGTEFMSFLSGKLRTTLKIVLNKRKRDGDFTPGKVEFSDASLSGEGEHKIIAKMADPKSKSQTREFHNMADVVFSPDADVHFLLMLNVPTQESAIIMREVHKRVEDGPKYEFFDVTGIRDDLKNGRKGDHGRIRTSPVRTIEDFALISCFAGNDFVPALPFIKYGVGDPFEAIVSAYGATFKEEYFGNFVYGRWDNLLLFLRTLAEKSEYFLRGQARIQEEQPSKFFNEKSGEDRRSAAIKMGTGRSDKGDVTFEPAFFDLKYNQKIAGTYHKTHGLQAEDLDYSYIDEMCHAYLEGLTWVLQYYLSQENPKRVNLNWAYTYHYAPNIGDLISYLERHSRPTWTNIPLLTTVVKTPFTPVEQLLAVLREEELHLLPSIAKALFLDKMPSLYPEKVRHDYTLVPFGKEYEGIILINFPDLLRIRTLFEAIKDDPTVTSRNHPVRNVALWPASAGRK